MTKEKDVILIAAQAATKAVEVAAAAATQAVNISYIQKDIAEIKDAMKNQYVTKAEFAPIQKIVWGVISVLGLATIGAILKLVFIR